MTTNPPSCFHPWVPCHPELPVSWLQAVVSHEGHVPYAGAVLASQQAGAGQGHVCRGWSQLGLLLELLQLHF